MEPVSKVYEGSLDNYAILGLNSITGYNNSSKYYQINSCLPSDSMCYII